MSQDEKQVTEVTNQQFPCVSCGAKLEYKVGSLEQQCPYCSAANAIPQSEDDIEELDFKVFLQTELKPEDAQEILESRCGQCGAKSSAEANETARECPFCSAPIVSHAQSTKQIKPKSLLPFAIESKTARSKFRDWVRGLWFAPNDLKKIARIGTKLTGMYVPYWTYDSQTTSYYSGQRGDYYYTTESYTDSNGNTKTRRVRHTRWSFASGVVFRGFDDVLVIASHALPRKMTRQLEPWDLQNLVGYQGEYLSGFSAQSYSLPVDEGFDIARNRMKDVIIRLVRSDIGGDEQRVTSLKTQHEGVTFKHILLPIWISSYRYHKKVYRFVVNGRTGEVQGDRPWSWVKIAFAVMLVLGVIGAIVYYSEYAR